MVYLRSTNSQPTANLCLEMLKCYHLHCPEWRFSSPFQIQYRLFYVALFLYVAFLSFLTNCMKNKYQLIDFLGHQHSLNHHNTTCKKRLIPALRSQKVCPTSTIPPSHIMSWKGFAFRKKINNERKSSPDKEAVLVDPNLGEYWGDSLVESTDPLVGYFLCRGVEGGGAPTIKSILAK